VDLAGASAQQIRNYADAGMGYRRYGRPTPAMRR
jgi:hypothetical protein